MIRFEVDGAKLTEFCVLVPGRVHEGTIRIGSIFTSVSELSADSPAIQLRVDKIAAYGHSLDELPEGMTGELQLSGEGMESLTLKKCPFTCVGV